MKTIKEVLKSARSLISKKDDWCVGAVHQISDAGRTQRCARGAILKAISPKNIHSVSERREIAVTKALLVGMIGPEAATKDFEDPVTILCDWNNTHKHKQVVNAFDKAIKALR